jgi:hypothetical protein
VHGPPDGFREHATVVIELTLLGDIARIKRVGVGLILVGRAMAKNDHVTAAAQCIDQLGLRLAWLSGGGQWQDRQQGE